MTYGKREDEVSHAGRAGLSAFHISAAHNGKVMTDFVENRNIELICDT
jgi:hypothetical protein